MNTQSIYDETYIDFVEQVARMDLSEEDTTAALHNLQLFSKCPPQAIDPELLARPEPESRWEKVKFGAARVWNNETTRVAIKAGGAFAGVLAVIGATIHRDHVLEKDAMHQANQRNS